MVLQQPLGKTTKIWKDLKKITKANYEKKANMLLLMAFVYVIHISEMLKTMGLHERMSLFHFIFGPKTDFCDSHERLFQSWKLVYKNNLRSL